MANHWTAHAAEIAHTCAVTTTTTARLGRSLVGYVKFASLIGCDKAMFEKWPKWKQQKRKKDLKLF